MTPKFRNLYMGMAEYIANQNTACPSRKVGAVIVDNNNKVKGVGYNGPPAGTPHCHSACYLKAVIKPRLTDDQCESLTLAYGSVDAALNDCEVRGLCPRKFLGYKSGEATDLCSCQHAESNAILNAACDVSGCTLFCTCAPCDKCAGAIINARIACVVYPAAVVYSEQALWLLAEAGVVCIDSHID